jgi:hypothetical protein
MHKDPSTWSRWWWLQNDTNEGCQVQNVKMSSGEKNGPEPAQKRPRPVGPFGPAQPTFVAVRVPLSSVLSICNLIAGASRHSPETSSSPSEPPRKRRSTTRETLGGGHSREIIAKPKGGCHEEGGLRELVMAPPELKDNEDPSSSEDSTISTVPCLVSWWGKPFVCPWSCNRTWSVVNFISYLDHMSIILLVDDA